jgi:hypothetical protein
LVRKIVAQEIVGTAVRRGTVRKTQTLGVSVVDEIWEGRLCVAGMCHREAERV